PTLWEKRTPALRRDPTPAAPCRVPGQGCATGGAPGSSRSAVAEQERQRFPESPSPGRLMVPALLVFHPAELAARVVAFGEQHAVEVTGERDMRVPLLQPDVEVDASGHV